MKTRHTLQQTAVTLALAASAALTSLGAEATLVARNLDGDATTAEAYFDTTLGITWMQDAQRLSSSLGLATTMTYSSAVAALASFNADASLNYGYASWRLPDASGVHTLGGAGCQFGVNGSTDCGENVVASSSELATMFHTTLGNQSWRDTSGAMLPGVSGVDFGLVNTGDFDNLGATNFWSGTSSYRLIFGIPQYGQVVFQMGNGTQSVASVSGSAAAWLVHDGDIGSAVTAAVPAPGSLGLAALGLAMLARRRRA